LAHGDSQAHPDARQLPPAGRFRPVHEVADGDAQPGALARGWPGGTYYVCFERSERRGFTPKALSVHDGWGVIRYADGQRCSSKPVVLEETQRADSRRDIPAQAQQARQEVRVAVR
jgi:hypothetical protein